MTIENLKEILKLLNNNNINFEITFVQFLEIYIKEKLMFLYKYKFNHLNIDKKNKKMVFHIEKEIIKIFKIFYDVDVVIKVTIRDKGAFDIVFEENIKELLKRKLSTKTLEREIKLKRIIK